MHYCFTDARRREAELPAASLLEAGESWSPSQRDDSALSECIRCLTSAEVRRFSEFLEGFAEARILSLFNLEQWIEDEVYPYYLSSDFIGASPDARQASAEQWIAHDVQKLSELKSFVATAAAQELRVMINFG